MSEQDLKGSSQEQELYFPRASDNKIINFLVLVLKGFGVGVGFILPGLSGGVLAVIFGLYDIILRFLANITHKFWEHVKFFIPVGIGGLLGIYFFSSVVSTALERYKAPAIALFIGFVIGTFPSLYKKAGARGRSKGDLALMLIVGVAFVALMIFLGERELIRVATGPVTWFFSGALIGLGVIVPGMSPSNFLLYLGLYDKMAQGIEQLDLSVIIPLGLGLIVCVVLLAKLVEYLFDRFYSKMYHFILALVWSSSLAVLVTEVLPALRPEALAASSMSFSAMLIICVVCLLVGTIASWLFSKVEERYDPEKQVAAQ